MERRWSAVVPGSDGIGQDRLASLQGRAALDVWATCRATSRKRCSRRQWGGPNEESEPPQTLQPESLLSTRRNRHPRRVFMQAARLPRGFFRDQDGRRNDHDHWHRRPRASRLPSVEIDSFNIELKDEEGFLETAPARALFGISSRNGGSRCANPAKTRSGKSRPKTSARRCSTPSWSATTPKPRRSFTARSRTLYGAQGQAARQGIMRDGREAVAQAVPRPVR